MKVLYLIKPGELVLKSGNRKDFEDKLKSDLKRRLSGIENSFVLKEGRFFLEVDEANAEYAGRVLACLPGISGWSRAKKAEKNIEDIAACAIACAREAVASGSGKAFKVESRRSDKSFPLDSYGISRELGSRILEAIPGLKVEVRKPDWVLSVEIREKAYVYGGANKGQRGLPVGSSGKGLLLLSGGIDSPVAGYLMAKRGLRLEAIHFHSYPFTSLEAQEKVECLAGVIAKYSGKIRLHVVPFTEVQQKIKQKAREDASTLLLRAAMMRASDILAKRIGAGCIVTGESLGQVASQTQENMRVTGSLTDLSILRPLAGLDKQDTIAIAKSIGSFGLSILPYEDCCVLFSPKHPVLRPSLAEGRSWFQELEMEPLIEEALASEERKVIEPDYSSRESLPLG